MTIIQLHNVTKSFHEHKILDDCSIAFDKNKIYGFIGPNGAGKTTTIKMLLGLLQPDAGTITVNGERVAYGDTTTNRYIGYLPDVPEYYHYMDAGEYLKLCGEITGVTGSELVQRIHQLLAKVGLEDNNVKINQYSRGMRQRLGIAQALINRPKIIICDEPTSALDPKGRQDILNILSSIKEETTVIFSTHILSDVEKICDEVVVLTKQKIVNLTEIRKLTAEQQLQLKLKLNTDQALVLAEQFSMKQTGEWSLYSLAKEETLEDFYRQLMQLNIYPEHLEVIDNNLEEIYMEVTT